MTYDPQFPLGKLNAEDEGQLAIACRAERGRVIIAFPKPVAWVGLSPTDVDGMIEVLLKTKADAQRQLS